MSILTVGKCVLSLALLTSLQVQVSAQALPYVVPAPYSNEEDDIGLLLAILLLTRNKGGSCCNCCNSCNGPQNVPIPFPIPFPSNNPVINTCRNEDEDTPKVKIVKGRGRGTKVFVDVKEEIEERGD